MELIRVRDEYEEQGKDLKAETTLVESFMAGQRNKHASWLWHFEDIIEGNTKEFGESSK